MALKKIYTKNGKNTELKFKTPYLNPLSYYNQKYFLYLGLL